jgi:DNA-binding transcriptional regulator LsrR (DeoR family)
VPGTGPTEVAALYAGWTGGRFHPLQAPAVADARALRRAVRPTTEIFNRVTVALVGIGARTDGAGHILVHVFDDDGRIVSEERSISLSVPQLLRATVVAAAGGRQKHRAIAGALRTGLIDVLVTDAACARYALR